MDVQTLNSFKPLPLMNGGVMQTISSNLIPAGARTPPFRRHKILLPDNDVLVMTETRPLNWKQGSRIIILIHGLAGCEDSPYIVRMNRKLHQQGYLVMKLNLRSCGPGMGLAKKPYHSGRSEDTRAVLHWLAKEFPTSPVTQIGFSLSANITVKMLGEDGSRRSGRLDSAVAVSPPLDLATSAQMIHTAAFHIFEKYFMRRLKNHVKALEKCFPDMAKTDFPVKSNILDFDDLYTGPRSGFKDGQDYYKQVSGNQFIENIATPLLLLYSKDDPVVSSHCLQQLNVPSCITPVITERGGHVGFLDKNGFWMDEVILDWLKSFS